MISWAIDAAIQSGLFDRLIVSTDDDEVAEVALAAGAEVPFRRPPELSDDHTPTQPVVRHAINWLLDHDVDVTSVCCIYATAPFLQPDRLVEGLRKLQVHHETEFVFSVAKFGNSIFRAIKLDESEGVSMYWPEYELSRSQDLPSAYFDAAQFYWGTADAWLEREGIFTSNARAVLLPSHMVQDIDTPEDWLRAEWMMRAVNAQIHDREKTPRR
jgi:N-acylneuraminate cytidylyltransferase